MIARLVLAVGQVLEQDGVFRRPVGAGRPVQISRELHAVGHGDPGLGDFVSRRRGFVRAGARFVGRRRARRQRNRCDNYDNDARECVCNCCHTARYRRCYFLRRAPSSWASGTIASVRAIAGDSRATAQGLSLLTATTERNPADETAEAKRRILAMADLPMQPYDFDGMVQPEMSYARLSYDPAVSAVRISFACSQARRPIRTCTAAGRNT